MHLSETRLGHSKGDIWLVLKKEKPKWICSENIKVLPKNVHTMPPCFESSREP